MTREDGRGAWLERAASAVAALALALAAAGLALQPLTTARVVHAIASRTSRQAEAGLDAAVMRAVVERVRVFVVEGRGTLPARVAGRAAFDERAARHLEDVRAVLRGARRATAVMFVAALGWVLGLVALGRRSMAGRLLRSAGLGAIAAPVLAGLFGLLSFDALFASFHALLFTEGSWVFPSDSLLIQAFPLRFWQAAGALWGLGTGIVGILLLWGAALLGAPALRPALFGHRGRRARA